MMYRIGSVAAALLLVVPTTLAATDNGGANVTERIRSVVQHYDLNRQEKFLIDFHFSPLYAMRTYRELLLWSDRAAISAASREDIHNIVSAGLIAVFRDSGAGVPLGGGRLGGTIGVAFNLSTPRYARYPDPQRPDTLVWGGERQAQAGPAGMGQSLGAKALWLRRGARDDSEAQAIWGSLLAELEHVTAEPFMSPGGDPFVPERLGWEDGRWVVQDNRSRLLSQASLLLGMLEVKALFAEAPTVGRLMKSAGGERQAWVKRIDAAIARLFQGLVAHHRDAQHGLLVDTFDRAGGRSRRVLMEDLGLTAEALGELARVGLQEQRAQARRLLHEQAEFVRKTLTDQTLAPRGWMLPKAVPFTGTIATLSEQTAAMTLLLEAAEVTGEAAFRHSALGLRNRMQESFWADPPGIHRSAAGYTVSAFDSFLFGGVLGWLRRVEATGEPIAAEGERYIEVVLKRGGLLQAEDTRGGEPAEPEALIDTEGQPLAAELSALDKEARAERTAAFIRRVVDRDGDSVPNVRYGGGRHGAAPVIVIQTSIKTPFTLKTRAAEKEGEQR